MLRSFAAFEAPDLAPILLAERTAHGWRGLTADGEIYNVKSSKNGATVIPERLMISDRDGRPLGYRELPNKLSDGQIDEYLAHFDRAVALMRANELATALPLMERALDVAPTTTAHYGRAMILLGLGRWREGFDVYERCERVDPYMRPNYRAALGIGLMPWRGEDLDGKRLLVMHDHGFGDSIMCLRFVPQLKRMGADVTLMVPQELEQLAAQCAPVTRELVECDYFCSFLHLLTMLKITPDEISLDPYLKIERGSHQHSRRTIGIAWSVGYEHAGDYPRAIPLELLREHFRDADLVPVQQPGGIFEDFAACAELMMSLDEIVTVDTAAVHLAGAIGHPKVTLLLSHWASWRWLSPWYRNLRICRQQSPGDWASALAQC